MKRLLVAVCLAVVSALAFAQWGGLYTTKSSGTGTGDALVANPLSQFAETTSAQLAGVISNETGSGLLVFGTNPVFITPTLGVASATSLATSAATPLLLTNGQLVNVALTSQTVGATTLTIPDFASVVDEFTFKTKAQTMSNKTFVAPALGAATGTSVVLTGAAPQITLGADTATLGAIKLFGNTSGNVTIQPNAVAGTNITLTAPATSGTILQSGTAVTVAQGGTGITAAAAGTVLSALTADTVTASAAPVLGASGTLGSLTMGNATSGTLKIQPVTGALGTVTLSLPAATDTLVGKATTDTLTNKSISGGQITSAVATATDTTTKSGNTSTYVTTTGAQTSGDCVKIDANGNHIANGSACGGSGAALSAITAATGANTIANANNTGQVWNWANTTDSTVAFQFGETSAATNGTISGGVDNQALARFRTLANSTQSPFQVFARANFIFGVDGINGRFITRGGTEAIPALGSTVGQTTGIWWPDGSTLALTASGGDVVRIVAAGVKLGASASTKLTLSITAPTLASGGCTSPTAVTANGTSRFSVGVGTSCSGSQPLVFTLPAATTGWNCYAQNSSNAASSNPAQSSAISTTSVTITNYSRTLGTAAAWTDSDVVVVSCLGG